MLDVFLIRSASDDEGTIGHLIAPEFEAAIIEPPWRDNEVGRSCIPEGEHLCGLYESPTYGQVYQVQQVPDRTWILIHAGNWAGDELKGYRSHSDGCLLIGADHAKIYGQKAVKNSRVTMRRWMDHMTGLDNGEGFWLHIMSVYGGG